MVYRFGERATFAIEIGERLDPGRRVVDLWGADRELSCDDNHAYVPQLCMSIERTLARLEPTYGRPLPWPRLALAENHRRLARGDDDDERDVHVFLDWGPTTDNVTSYLFEDGADMIMTFSFWRPSHPRPEELDEVFVARTPHARLVADLRAVLDYLKTEG